MNDRALARLLDGESIEQRTDDGWAGRRHLVRTTSDGLCAAGADLDAARAQLARLLGRRRLAGICRAAGWHVSPLEEAVSGPVILLTQRPGDVLAGRWWAIVLGDPGDPGAVAEATALVSRRLGETAAARATYLVMDPDTPTYFGAAELLLEIEPDYAARRRELGLR